VTDVPPETQETLLVVLFTVIKQLVVAIEALLTETAFWVTLEARGFCRVLVGLASVSVLEMPHKLRGRHQVVLMRKYLFVTDTEITRDIIDGWG